MSRLPKRKRTAAPAPTAGPDQVHEIKIVGRGGQGVVTAGELLGRAALSEGRHAQSIPTFGPERRGALSQVTLRLSTAEILLKCSQARPEVVLLLDPTIWQYLNVFLGLRKGANLVFNSTRSPEEIEQNLKEKNHGHQLPVEHYSLCVVDATGIALETLGRPITNTAMMGAFSGATGLIELASVERILAERFGEKADMNIEAARLAQARLARLDRRAGAARQRQGVS